MAVSRLPHSLNLLHTNTNNHNLPVSRVSLSSPATANTSYTIYPAKHFQRIFTKNKPFHNHTVSTDFPSLWKTIIFPNELVADDRVLIEEYADEKNGASEQVKTEEEEVIASLVNRLMAVVEKMREREMQKFLSKVNKELSYEDSVILAEETSKEIVNKFLEKPIAYLRNNNGRTIEQKLKDFSFLIGVLENSCPANQR
ncbi:hypothetical protein Patl1_03436 [Pistacia atlantica]|uniref:Uncharacterized protein n=1 Tax=Pistacia atlantica TaxID=434234 RepID=A0ACC1CCX8_9ROSI|nr:hypothetical protein Patl1_03436 [Pistacia atlantica]